MSIKLMTKAFDTNFDATKKILLLAICDAANDSGGCFLLISTLIKKCGLSERSIQNYLKELKEDGLLDIEYRKGRSSIFTISTTKLTQYMHPAADAPTPAADAPTPAADAPTPAADAPITVSYPFSNRNNNHKDTIALKDSATIGFEQFWKTYPNKKAKGDALRAWKKINVDAYDKIFEAIKRQKNTEDWKKESGKYIPYPATWLNGLRWEDEVSSKPDYEPDSVYAKYDRTIKAMSA